jgi:hypothetical protein
VQFWDKLAERTGKFLLARQLIRGNIAESSKDRTFCAEAARRELKALIIKKISKRLSACTPGQAGHFNEVLKNGSGFTSQVKPSQSDHNLTQVQAE